MNSTERFVAQKVKQLFAQDSSGHDFSHTERVWKLARKIGENYDCSRQILSLAALLHDADDPKLFSTRNHANARRILEEAGIGPETADQVIGIISKISFKGSGADVPESIEGKIVQDADRLDAIGAIGIARAFAYGGSRGRKMHDPEQPPDLSMDEAAYRSRQGTTINHFYEKLLLLKSRMNTPWARELAEERTRFMEEFLGEFLEEWDGKK